MQQYLKDGYLSLVELKSGGNNTKTISEKAQFFIAEKVNNKNTTITSYVELQLLIEEEPEKRSFMELYILIAERIIKPSLK
ncbi:hypothetical protein ACFQZF_07670 [Flavobacterium myungsuense]|uniref:hypothetical protein n=1 Tax=Flavobacterium myungsuense TaxID=651823 RepID=UPI003633F4D2